jgi:hypothetical protein
LQITIAKQKHLALTVAIPMAAAFLVELTFLAIIRRMVSFATGSVGVNRQIGLDALAA